MQNKTVQNKTVKEINAEFKEHQAICKQARNVADRLYFGLVTSLPVEYQAIIYDHALLTAARSSDSEQRMKLYTDAIKRAPGHEKVLRKFENERQAKR